MQNPLQQNNTPPTPPEISSQQDNGLRMPMAQTDVGAQNQQVIPRPSHAQTVAALRHFNAIGKELRTLLEIPGLGKSDVKPQIIEGTTKLVADRIITPAQAVMQLATVPVNPPEQRKWIEQNFLQMIQAENAVLEHHRAGQEGLGDFDIESTLHGGEGGGDHISTMNDLMKQHYNG